MTTYYVSKQGSDSNNGLGPDASHASNKPFLTIGKLIATSGAMASGDTAYIGPGTYREVVTANITSPTGTTSIIGDPGNAQGFKTSGGALVAPADVIMTAFTTNDATTPSSSALLALNARDFLSFSKMTFIGGTNTTGNCISAGASTTNPTFTDCVFIGSVSGPSLIALFDADGVADHWLIDRCIFLAPRGGIAFSLDANTQTSVDLDLDIVIQNSLFIIGNDGQAFRSFCNGAGSFFAGGIVFRNNTVIGGTVGFSLNSASKFSTSIPSSCYNNIFYGQGTGISAATSGQIIENYNRILANTARTNVTAGSNSQAATAYAMALEVGQALLFGRQARPFLSPMLGSPLLGFGNQSGAPTVDLLNRPRPAGGGSATTSAPITGTATAGAGSTMTDGGKSWTTNEWAGYTLRLTGGTGSGQQRYISSNTGTVITVSTAWVTNPDATSTYTIDNSGIYAAIGAHERHDTAAQEASTTQAGSSAIKIIGPGDHDFVIPVDASSATISIYARYDTLHGTGSKPQIILLANGAIGVTTETKTMTAAADTWEQLSFASQTPSAKGYVTVRCISRAAAGQGVAYFDTMAGGASGTSGLDYFRNAEPFPALVAGGSGGGLMLNPGMSGGMSE